MKIPSAICSCCQHVVIQKEGYYCSFHKRAPYIDPVTGRQKWFDACHGGFVEDSAFFPCADMNEGDCPNFKDEPLFGEPTRPQYIKGDQSHE